MKIFGKEFKFNDNKVYHAGDKPVAADIKFTDGKTFQQKLDDGSLRGPQGPQGVKGDTGAKGATGNTGPQGPQGIQGIQGPKGDTGAKGATGSTGAKGVSMRLKGAWSSTTAYVNDSNYIDLVTSGGNTYACKASNTNQAVTNTTYWELIAQKGNTGATGPQGPQGVKGDTGAQGPTGATGAAGATPTIKAGTVTTGNAGTNASVTASTSGTTTTFNFTIPRGDTGAKGATGATGPAGKDGTTPHIGSNGNWYVGSTDLAKPARGATGPQGPKGADGLTTSVTVNGTRYTHSSGNITLPNYPTLSSLGGASSSHNHDSVYLRLSGGTVTGKTNFSGGANIGTTLEVGENIWMNNNKHIISKDTSGNNIYLLSYNSSHNLHLGSTIYDNSMTVGATYLSGATELTLRTVNGPINFIADKELIGHATTTGIVLGTNESQSSIGTTYKTYDIYRKCNSSLSGYSHTNARFGLVDADNGVAALETKLYNTSGATIKTAYFRLDANSGRAYTDGYFQSGQKWMKLGSRWLTIDTAAPSGAKGDIWIQCY